MKSRPSIHSGNKSYKIKKVMELSKEGEYLKDKFYKSKISEGTKSIFGYKEFLIPENYKGYDREFYETLIGSHEKSMFATYVREMEVGEFKNNKLNGFGARCLTELPGYNISDDSMCNIAGLIGNFINGFPDKKILYFNEASERHNSLYALTIWNKGKLENIYWDYKEEGFDVEEEIQESRFWSPWGQQKSIIFKNEKWWEAYKNEFLE